MDSRKRTRNPRHLKRTPEPRPERSALEVGHTPDGTPVKLIRRRQRPAIGAGAGHHRRGGKWQVDLPDGQKWDPLTEVHPDAGLDRRMYFQALIKDVITDTHPCMPILTKEGRRRWLAYMATTEHVEERVVSMGDGLGFDIVKLRTSKPNFVAMELLQRMEGDFATAGVNVSVNGEGSRVLLLVPDNGRGPAPVSAPELIEAEVGEDE